MWEPGVPLGSVLGKVLFNINDVDVELNNFVNKSVNDTKIENSVLSKKACITSELHLIDKQYPFI